MKVQKRLRVKLAFINGSQVFPQVPTNLKLVGIPKTEQDQFMVIEGEVADLETWARANSALVELLNS